MRDLTKKVTTVYHSSMLGTQAMQESVKSLTEFNVSEHLNRSKETDSKSRHAQKDIDLAMLNTLIYPNDIVH